jgi:hypothetical protein
VLERLLRLVPRLEALPAAPDRLDRRLLALGGLAVGLVALGGGVVATTAGRSLERT